MHITKITNRQLYYILFMMRSTIILAILPPVVTVFNAHQDAWASVIVSFFTSAILVTIICKLGLHFPEMTIFEYSQKLIGPWPGRVLCLLILWGFLGIATIDLRIYGESIIANFLPETPMIVIISAMAIVAAATAYYGLETIGWATDLLFPLYLLMIVLSLTLPLPQAMVQLHNLEPVLARGIWPVLGGSAVITAMIANHLVLTMLIPAVTKTRKVLNTVLWSLGTTTLVIAFTAVIVVAILGHHKASRNFLPFFSMIKAVTISQVFERVEILAMTAWGFGLFILLAVVIYSGAKGLSQVLGLKDYRPLIVPMTVIWIIMAKYSMESVFAAKEFFSPDIFVPLWIGLILFPFAILWGAYFLRRRRL